MLKFVDSTLVEAFIVSSEFISEVTEKIKEILPVFTCFVQRLITKMQPLFLGRLTEGGQQLSQYTGGYCCRRGCRELITVKFGKTDQRAEGKKHLLYL